MSLEYQIVLALLLDAMIGDPRWLPHPVRIIGRLALKMERISRVLIPHDKSAGIISVLSILPAVGFSCQGLIRLAGTIHPHGGDLISILILYTCFAARDLITHSSDVHDALQKDDLKEAQKRVGLIVGRDTMTLGRAGVVRAAVESVAENSVDGVTAPLFWAVVGGPVGALLYKAVNTLDSTFGYKNERYLYFGWAAARLDDLVNWLPARLTGLVMIVAARFCRLSAAGAWRIFRRDRNNHTSPNAGQSEAPMAGALGIQLGGPSIYFGKVVVKPTIGDDLEQPEPLHIDQANLLLIMTTGLAAVMFILARLLVLH